MEVLPSTLYEHIDAIAHAQDGSFAIASSAMTVRTWNGCLWTFKDSIKAPDPDYSNGRTYTLSGITDIQWLDSTKIVVGLDDGSVEIWTQSGNLPGLENLASMTEHDDIVSTISIDCAKRRLLSGSYDRSIKIWDLDSEQCIRTYKGHSESVYAVHCSHTEQDLFLSASQDGSVVLWDTRKPKPAKRLADPTNYCSIPHCLDWSPLDSNIFATGFEDGSIHVYSIKDTTEMIYSYTPHSRAINRVAFSPRSPEWLASVSDDTIVHVQNLLNNTTVLRSDTHSDYVHGLSWNPQDDSLMTSGWDKAVVTHMFGSTACSDLVVEVSKSHNTSVFSVDSESQFQPQVNGGAKAEEESMDVADSETSITNGFKTPETPELKAEEMKQESS